MAVPDRPIGVNNLLGFAGKNPHPSIGSHWWWCRAHERAEHSGWARLGCVRIGPFETEREANILRREHPEHPEGDKPLGMEIEH